MEQAPCFPSVPARAELCVYLPCLPEQKAPPGCEPGRTHDCAKGFHPCHRHGFGREPPAGVRFRKILKMQAAYRWLQRTV